MTLDEWLGEQARLFRANQDADRLNLMQCYVRGYEARERDPDLAFAAFTETARIRPHARLDGQRMLAQAFALRVLAEQLPGRLTVHSFPFLFSGSYYS